MNWAETNSAILAALDIAAEYETFGVRFVGLPDPSGWRKCYAMGRDDRHPSAAVCVAGKQIGRYKDFGGGAGGDVSCGFFDFAAKYGGFADWKAARANYAEKAGISLNGAAKTPRDKLQFLRYSTSMARLFCATRAGITPEALQLAGAQLAIWNRQLAWALPAYRESPPLEPCGYAILHATGGMLALDRKGERGEIITDEYKVRTVGGSLRGLLNKHAIEHLATAEVVWKAEGVTDMLAIQSSIPAELRTRHVVLSNLNGASENIDASWAHLLKDKEIRVIHDADKPGQLGALRWSAANLNAKSCVNVELPYKISAKHGKDARDFLRENSYDNLLSLPSKTILDIPKADELLAKLQIEVLGEYDDGSVEIYSTAYRKLCHVKSVQHMGFPSLLQIVGTPALDFVNPDPEPQPGKVSIMDVRNRIALEAGRTRLYPDVHLGMGAWRAHDGNVIIVDSKKACIWDGALLKEISHPRYEDHILDFGARRSWFHTDALRRHLSDAANPTYRQVQLTALTDILRQWNWKKSCHADLVACLMMATFVQSLWKWRPCVALSGSSSTGKSTFFEFMAELFGNLSLLSEKPSEAGLRQAIRNRSQAVILDEFERGAYRHVLLELLRTSGKGGKVLRGTSDQRGMEYGLLHIVWVGAIETGLFKEADRNRYIPLELDRFDRAKHGRITLPRAEACADFGLRLFASILRVMDEAIPVANQLSSHVVEAVPGRMIECYAVPAAIYATITGETPVAALEYLLGVEHRATEDAESIQHEEEMCIESLLSSPVDCGHGNRFTVGEILSCRLKHAEHHESLARCGITAVASRRGPRSFDSLPTIIFIDATTVQRHLLKDTRWRDLDLEQMLLRLHGAKRMQRSMSGRRPWGVDVNIAPFLSEPEDKLIMAEDYT